MKPDAPTGPFEQAKRHAETALAWADRLPHSDNRTRATDNLKAAIGWIKQARDEWAMREAGQ